MKKINYLKKLREIFDIKKKVYFEEKDKDNKKYHIENAEIFQDLVEIKLLECKDMKTRYYLMQIYRYGYQNIRSINCKLAFKKLLDNDDINFLKILKEANILHTLNEIYTKKEVKKMLNEFKSKELK